MNKLTSRCQRLAKHLTILINYSCRALNVEMDRPPIFLTTRTCSKQSVMCCFSMMGYCFVELIGYCLKDEQELHHHVVMKQISESMIADGKELSVLMGASKNRVELTYTNILGRSLQFNEYKNSNSLFTTFNTA